VTPRILNRRWPATAKSLPDARHATIDALTRTGVVNRQLLAAIALALSEAFGNAVRHAYPDAVGDVHVSVDSGTNEISVTVADTGVGIARPTQEPGLGLGLQLIDALTTTRMIDSDPTGTTLTMRFNSDHEPPSPEHTPDVQGDPETPV
jgi:anti-sigma regulatory factor (Ser/Thr protein kinase)